MKSSKEELAQNEKQYLIFISRNMYFELSISFYKTLTDDISMLTKQNLLFVLY